MPEPISPQHIIEFWYSEKMRQRWFSSTPELDAEIRSRYESLWIQAGKDELDDWKASPEGCLALVIVLDQFPLNMFRAEAKSFSTEQKAVACSKYCISQGFDRKITQDRVAFLYMPLMHSENIADQDLAVTLFEQANLPNSLHFAKHHRELIRRFGRFPHRNRILGRNSSTEEIEYLNSREAFLG